MAKEEPAPSSRPAPHRIAVLGLGNPVLTDDAVGLRVADRVRELLAADPVPGVEVLESTRGGFDLIDLLGGFDMAVIVDALEAVSPAPGRVHRLDLAALAGSARLVSAHEIDLATAFELASRLQVPMPARVEIYGVEGGDMRTLSESLTPPLAACVDPLAREIHALVRGWAAGQGPAAGA